MKVVVIGLGSMGKRRIRLIRQMDESIQIIGIDSDPDRQKEVQEKFGLSTVSGIHEVATVIDSAFVCTSPLSHAAIIHQCLAKGWHVFTELNLVSDLYDENMALAKEKGIVLFLSSTFLYRDEVNYIRQAVAESNCRLNYCYHIGQYLPDWHPWESYQSYFVSDKRTNGCREILSIELPWLIDVFGKIDSFHVQKDNLSSLELSYPDNYVISTHHESGAKGCLMVDVVSRKAVRNLEVFGERLYLAWNGSPENLIRYDYQNKREIKVEFNVAAERQKGYSAFIIENAYRREIEAFFSQMQHGEVPAHTFSKDKDVLSLIDKIENARA